METAQVQSQVLQLVLQICDPFYLDVHPLNAFFKLELVLIPFNPSFADLFSQTAKLLKKTDNKQLQTLIVKEVCLKSELLMYHGDININMPLTELILDKSDSTSYNIEAVINEASELSNKLESAFTSEDIKNAIKMYEMIAIRVKSLLLRIKGTKLYDEIVSATGINENNIFDVLSTDDVSDAKRRVTQVLDQILTFIKTHFK